MFLVGPEIRSKSKTYAEIENIFIITLLPLIFIIILLNAWAKHKIKDELKEKGVINEEEDNR